MPLFEKHRNGVAFLVQFVRASDLPIARQDVSAIFFKAGLQTNWSGPFNSARGV